MTDKTPRAWDGALEQEFYTPEEIAASDARVGKAHRMLYREKVIEGLKFTLEESGWDANAAYDQELMIQAVADAIALLKAQEPRVMTLEASDADWRDGVLWFEHRDGKTIKPCLFVNCRDMVLFGRLERVMCFDVVGRSGSVYMLKNYGVKYRCWTSCPTDEQRGATPWA